MRFRPKYSIKARLILTVVTLWAIFVLVQVISYPVRLDDMANKGMLARASTTAELLAYTSSEDLKAGASPSELRQPFLGAEQNDDFLYAVLYSRSGQRLASVNAEAAPSLSALEWKEQVFQEIMASQIIATQVVDIGASGEALLVVGYSNEEVQYVMLTETIATLVAGLVIMLIGAGIALWLGRLIGDRADGLSEIAKEVATGRTDMELLPITMADDLSRMAESFNSMLLLFKALQGHFDQVARGDLSHEVTVGGDLAESFQRMVDRQRNLVRQIQATAAEMRSSSAEILASSRSQERGAAEQAAVVEQTLRTMETLLDATTQIADSSQTVLDNAERTHENIEIIAERVSLLASHTQRISEVLEVIKDIANKTDLLALNASLEGTRAGEAGRGFSQVAVRMQRLTENVMGAVRDIKSLTVDIREATGASVLATEEASKRASSSAESARLIRYTIQQQQSGTQQVTQSMDEISDVIQRTVSSSSQLAATASQLSQLSERMQQQVEEFKLPELDAG